MTDDLCSVVEYKSTAVLRNRAFYINIALHDSFYNKKNKIDVSECQYF